jgi:uncharacterized damage-inducible protein DinB
MISTIISLFERDLNKLIEEINLYKNEDDLWKIKEGISNSGGNLALHLVGSLNHFIGATLGNTGYVGERDKEFSLKNIPRGQIVRDIRDTIEVIKNTLSQLTEEDLDKDFPVAIGNKVSSTSYTLLFFIAHLNYHLGQINYLRRMSEP